MAQRFLTRAGRPLACMQASMAGRVAARQFSHSPTLGLKAVFSEVENPELNKTLAEIQEKIILPAYLPHKQREMIFDPKQSSHLQQNPIVIELDGLEHKFSSIDLFHGIPNSKKIFNDALDQMKTTEDWQNLPTLLAGYEKAGIKLQPGNYARLCRLARIRDQIYIIIDSAKQASKTGFKLDRKEYVAQLLVGINNTVVDQPDNAAQAAKAWNWTEQILDLLHRPEHTESAVSPIARPANSPFARSLALFSQASDIQAKQKEGKPVKAEMAALAESAELVSTLWSRNDINNLAETEDVIALNPHQSREFRRRMGWDSTVGGFTYLFILAQSVRGLSLTRELLGNAAKDLSSVEEALHKHTQDFIRHGKNNGRKPGPDWFNKYEAITGRKLE